MKISHLQENLTPSSAPTASVPGPKFGRSDEMLESGASTTAGDMATDIPTNMGVQSRGGKKSIFKGIKTSEKYANSRKAGISEDAINEDDLSEEQLQAKQRREDLFNRAKDRDIGNKPKSREIMARESDTDDNPKPGSWQEIAKLNNITDPTKLRAGQVIQLPNDLGDYQVPKGDTLSGIAQRLRSPRRDPQYGEPEPSTKNIDNTPISKTTDKLPDNTDYKPEITTPPEHTGSAGAKGPTAKEFKANLDAKEKAKGNAAPSTSNTDLNANIMNQLRNLPGTSQEKVPAKAAPAKATPQPDIHSQASQDAQWEKDKQNMGNAWDDFKNWVKKPRSFNIVPGKDKPPVDPSHDIGQRAGLSPDEIVKRLQSMPGAKDDTPPAKPQKSTSSKTSSVSPNLSPDHKVIAGIESGNKDYKDDGTPVVSPKGAQYAMQVMKNTNRDPGYGVKPAQDSSPEESNRVGRDYYNALLKKHDGDKEKAAAAYNAGPGRLDKILAKAEETGKHWKDLLPRETRHYVRKFNKGTAVASNNDDSMNEDISQKYARDYDYILTYLLAEADPRYKGNRGLDIPPLEGGGGGSGGFVSSKPSIFKPQQNTPGHLEPFPSMRGSKSDPRPGLQRQQAQTTTDMSTGKSLAQRQTAADELNAKMDQLAPRPAVQRAQDRVQQQATQDVAQQLKNPGPSVWKNPKTGVVSNTPPPADVAPPAPLKSLGGKSFKDASKEVNQQNNNNPSIHPNWSKDPAELLAQKGNMFARNPIKTGVGVLTGLGLAGTYGVDKVNGKKTDNNDSTTANDDPDLKIDKDYETDERPLYVPPEEKSAESNKPTPVQTKNNSSDKNTVKSTDSGEDDSVKIDKNYDETDKRPLYVPTNESKVSRMIDEYEQILESLMGKVSLSEERTETKNEKGEVTSWRDESDWRKVSKDKDGRGRVTNLSDKARRETEKLKKEVAEAKPDFAAKFKKNIDKHNTAVVKTKKEIGTRVADIGPGGKEYNVKTDKEWDKQKGVTEMNVGKRKPKPDSYHINKDGKPVSLASYGDKDSAIKDRDEKHPGAEVHQVGSRGKVKGKFEEGALEEEKPGLWANIHAKQERIKHGSGEKMRKPGSKGAPTADALRKSAK